VDHTTECCNCEETSRLLSSDVGSNVSLKAIGTAGEREDGICAGCLCNLNINEVLAANPTGYNNLFRHFDSHRVSEEAGIGRGVVRRMQVSAEHFQCSSHDSE